jgi:AcrR family transcriptional regulator
MKTPQSRKKEPEKVRLALLDGAARLAAEGGLASVSVQSVSTAAGVTKGAFFYHFENKQALLDSLFNWLLEPIASRLDELIAEDPEPHGCFTRAYVRAVFENGANAAPSTRDAVWISTITDAQLRSKWADWFNARLIQHRLTDQGATLEMVRLAVDGIWLTGFAGIPIQNPQDVHDVLIGLTYAVSSPGIDPAC